LKEVTAVCILAQIYEWQWQEGIINDVHWMCYLLQIKKIS